MSKAMRGAVALCLAVASLFALPAIAQQLQGERDRISYMIGMDVGQSLAPIGPDLDYQALTGLRLEARQKLDQIRPLNLGQASRVSGVSPADISVLMIYLEHTKQKHTEQIPESKG